MPRTLTARTIETLKPGPKRKEIPDGYLPNLYLILQPSGVRSWAVRYRIGRRPRKYTFGSYPAFDLKAARELGAKALRAVAEGRDPAREKALARSAAPDTVGSIAEQFVALHCKRLNRPRTIDATQRVLDLHVLPVWKNRLIKEISRRDVIELLDGVIASGRPVAANRTLTALTTMFRWATDRDILVTSPCTGVRPPTPEVSRDRVLTDVELNNVWRAAGKLTPAYRDLVRLLILTGQRRDEVARMTWAELDLDGRLWKLPKERTKNGRPHEVPLSEPVLAMTGKAAPETQ